MKDIFKFKGFNKNEETLNVHCEQCAQTIYIQSYRIDQLIRECELHLQKFHRPDTGK